MVEDYGKYFNAPQQAVAPASSGGEDYSKYFGASTGTPTATPAPVQQSVAQKVFGFNPTSITDIGKTLFQKNIQPVENIASGVSDFFNPKGKVNTATVSLLNDLRKNLTDIPSGKSMVQAAQGNKLYGNNNPLDQIVGSVAQKWFDTVGSKLYFNDKDAKAAADELKKNPDYWTALGGEFNVLTAPFLARDLASAGATAIGKELPLPSMVNDAFSFFNHVLPEAITTGIGKGIQNTFGKFNTEVLGAHLPWAQEAISKDLTVSDLQSQAGRHVTDWVTNMANKIHFARGGDEVSKLSNSDILQAWSSAKNIFGSSLQEISKNMDKFATTMNRVVGGVQGIGSKLGVDPSLTDDLTLYTKDYMSRARAAAKEAGHASPSFVDQLTQIFEDSKNALTTKDQAAWKEYIKAIKLVEEDTGYKVGSGHASFVDPKTLQEIPKTVLPSQINAIPATVAKAVKETPVSRIFNTFKGILDPQVFTNDTKQSLIQARFRTQLTKAGLDPVEVFKKIGAFRATGQKLSTSDPGSLINRGAFVKVFGEDSTKVIDAASEAARLPFKISGLSTSQLARRVPFASPMVQALFGLRWKVNPVFQLAKLPTKLYEIGAASGITPWSPEASQAVAHYVQTYNKPMLARIIDNFDTELQYQGKTFGGLAKKVIAGTENQGGASAVVNSAAKFVDHITSADEKVYAKGVYKYLKDKGYDLTSVPIDEQLDHVIKNIPIDVLGAADNYAATLTKYGQGTSPLQNTLNTIFFPLLFHMKVAKFALAGTLRFPVLANAIGDLVGIQNKWALSPEGQQFHRTPGLPQFMLHLLGSAEPVNVPALTGRNMSLQEEATRSVTPYNPVLTALLQGTSDVTGQQLPGTQAPTSRFEIEHPVISAASALTGYGSVSSQFSKLEEALGIQKAGYTPTLKSLKKEIHRQQNGLLPESTSLTASLRNFQGSNTLSDVQKLEYARMRASYDFPDDTDKQQQEIDKIIRLWKRVKPVKI